MKLQSIPSEYTVRVRCITYNHAPYIEDAMNGFCIQETTFPFICVIIDDASTDGEQEAIKKYMEMHFDLGDNQCFREEDTDDYYLIFARHKTNSNCFFGVLLLKYNHWIIKKTKEHYYEQWSKAKFIAFCDGDDYWTDSGKLQKQINVLEECPNVMLTHTAFENVDCTGNPIKREKYEYYMRESRSGDVFERLLEGNYILTLTMCIRKEVIESILLKELLYMDYNISLSAAALGCVHYSDEVTGCYRMSPNSAIMSNMETVVSKSKYIRNYFYSMILTNKIKKYSYKRNFQLKIKAAEYACDCLRRYDEKEPMMLLSHTTYSFYFYLFIVILKKIFKRFTLFF